MPLDTLYLPNGQTLTIRPVFGGLLFKSNDLSVQNPGFPAGWTIIIQSEDFEEDHEGSKCDRNTPESPDAHRGHHHIHRFKLPTARNDSLFISSLMNPTTDFKPPASPTRQIALMLWATLYWYFHQPEPRLYITTRESEKTPDAGKPRVDWRVNIKREGVFRGRNLLQKLERMGLISSEDSSVGSNSDDRSADGWTDMFVSRRSFWQLSAKLFLFTLSPNVGAPYPGSPYGSRPASPVRNEAQRSNSPKESDVVNHRNSGVFTATSPGPFNSGSHLPTYYPPPPLQYRITDGIRHPIRGKPPRQGEIFYTRYIPSMGQYLSFRAASSNEKPVAYDGPISMPASPADNLPSPQTLSSLPSHFTPPTAVAPGIIQPKVALEDDTSLMSDVQLLHKWMNIPRISKFWGSEGHISLQKALLTADLESKHSFPVIGCWDGKPFGYFVVYWVKEDILGKHLGAGQVEDWDRGVHVLVGEDAYRGQHRVNCWMTSLVHWAFTDDLRTNSFMLEPRIDNTRFIDQLKDIGFSKDKEISFPHKQAALLRYRRENFDGPSL